MLVYNESGQVDHLTETYAIYNPSWPEPSLCDIIGERSLKTAESIIANCVCLTIKCIILNSMKTEGAIT